MINVMMNAEPVDLTPTLDQLKADIVADILADNAANVLTIADQTAAIDTKIDDLTTVNGNISTEVQAINTNTNAKIDEVKADIAAKGVIKSVQRGLHNVPTNSTALITISAVNVSKATFNISCRINPTVHILDETTLSIRNESNSVQVSWEVIEYE